MRHSPWRRWTGLVLAALALSPLLARTSIAKDASDEASAHSSRAWLGVYTQPLDQDLRDEFKFRGDGVLVNRVVSDSPADKAGIQKGDIITSLNGHSVDSPSALANAVADGKDGQSVSVRLTRDGQSKTITAKLASRDADDDQDMGPGDVEIQLPHDMHDMGDMHDMQMGLPGVMRWMGRGRLGIQTGELNPELGSYFGVPSGKGVLVMSVVKDTPAERAGIKAGDVITRVNDKAVADAGDLIEALPSDGGKVTLTVVRKGASRTISADIAKSEGMMRVHRDGPGRGQTWSWRSDDDHTPNVIRLRDRAGDDDLRKQLDDFKRELERLRAEMERLKK